jgi:nitroreductase
MGSVFEVIKRRHSVRGFDQKDVETQKLSAVVKRRETIIRLAEAVPFGPKSVNSWIKSAPLIIAACARPDPLLHRMGQMVDKDYHRIDVAIAVEHMVLTATDLSLDTCIVGWFSRKKARKLLRLPLSMEVVLLLVIGYGRRGQLGRGSRKRLQEIVSFESYGAHRSTEELM